MSEILSLIAEIETKMQFIITQKEKKVEKSYFSSDTGSIHSKGQNRQFTS